MYNLKDHWKPRPSFSELLTSNLDTQLRDWYLRLCITSKITENLDYFLTTPNFLYRKITKKFKIGMARKDCNKKRLESLSYLFMSTWKKVMFNKMMIYIHISRKLFYRFFHIEELQEVIKNVHIKILINLKRPPFSNSKNMHKINTVSKTWKKSS